jgi:hypothetical protein
LRRLVSGRKAALIQRLCTQAPDHASVKRKLQRNVVWRLIGMIERCAAILTPPNFFCLVSRLSFLFLRRYGDDGFGDKPRDMCRVEYWLAHIDPATVQLQD